MNYERASWTTVELIESAFRRTMFPHLNIKFKLSLHTETSNYAGTHFLESLPAVNYNTAAEVTVQESLSCDDVREVLVEAIGDRLPDFERRLVIKLAWAEVRKSFPAETLHKHIILSFAFKIMIRNKHVYAVESDCPRMVPAADSSFRLLENCDEVGCCICLEELGGGLRRTLRMPCSHVFHDGCIKKWLRRSHYCPVCRYEMPTK